MKDDVLEKLENGVWSKFIKEIQKDQKRFQLIKDWDKKELICSQCGTNKSVKYEFGDNAYCNVCMLCKTLEVVNSNK